MKFYKDQPALNKVHHAILDFWNREGVMQKSIDQRKGQEPFVFYEGPPSANGMPGIHHVVSRTLKDTFCRFKALTGHYVLRKAGWDTHGLPVELAVEKKLGIKKEQVGKDISIADYNSECQKTVMECKEAWDNISEKIGYWLDLKNPYITYENSYIESIWWILKKLHSKNLLYKGYKIQPYSPAAGTGISSHELNQPGCYKDVKDVTVIAQFELEDSENEFFLAWTTTPWTLPANSALAINKNFEYSKILTFNRYTGKKIKVLLASDAVSRYFLGQESDYRAMDDYIHDVKSTSIPWKIVEKCKGIDLLGKKYYQLFNYVKPNKPAFKIIHGDFVTAADGTGIVHIAPTFGSDDMIVAQKNDIPSILVKLPNGQESPIVDKTGRYVAEMGEFAGLFVKEAYEDESIRNSTEYKSLDTLITIKLKTENKAFLVQKMEHSYPHCWRTDKPVIYYPLDSWFIKTTDYKDKLIELNKTINWMPSSVGKGRFGDWLENLVDWNLSRDRFWGTPLPIWRTKSGDYEICIGSIEELRSEVEKSIKAGFMKGNLQENFNLHKPFVDEIILVSPSGEPMYRESEIIDVWFDSGAMPYAQWHYPFENKEKFEQNFPADFIAEGIDQTRGWFFTLHVLSVMLYDSVAFKNVLVNGLVLDKNGVKMSKRLGNVLDPFEVIEKYGPDAVRWYILSNSNIHENIKFNVAGIEECISKFFGTLQNSYKFFALYTNIDNYEAKICVKDKLTNQLDIWILSRLHSLIKKCRENFEQYNARDVARDIQDFVVEELSNWYVRLNRKRFWQSDNSVDKFNAYDVLYTCLCNVTKLMAPISPFYADQLFKDLNPQFNNYSVHLQDFSIEDSSNIATEIESKMKKAQDIVSLTHSLRKKSNLKVRQPLANLFIAILKESDKEQLDSIVEIILSETNIKNITYINDLSSFTEVIVKPNFKSLSMKYKKELSVVAEAIVSLEEKEICNLRSGKSVVIRAQNIEYEIFPNDILISYKDIQNMCSATDGKNFVAIETSLTEELIQEGIAREFINRIQSIRKNNDFDVQDKIFLKVFSENQQIRDSLKIFEEYIVKEVQAIKFEIMIESQDENIDHIEVYDNEIGVLLQKSL